MARGHARSRRATRRSGSASHPPPCSQAPAARCTRRTFRRSRTPGARPGSPMRRFDRYARSGSLAHRPPSSEEPVRARRILGGATSRGPLLAAVRKQSSSRLRRCRPTLWCGLVARTNRALADPFSNGRRWCCPRTSARSQLDRGAVTYLTAPLVFRGCRRPRGRRHARARCDRRRSSACAASRRASWEWPDTNRRPG